ncbi:MAG: ATP-grasp domain-containing protein [Candidatus Methanomethylicaceae archaeon]
MIRVLVFPSCNEPGLEVINSLACSNKIMLFGGSSVDVEYDPSRLLLKNHLACPSYYDSGFREMMEKLIEEHQIDVVFPTMDLLVAEFSRWHLPRTRFITPNSETAHLFLSKLRTYERLQGLVPVPRLYDFTNFELPAYAKPDIGSGSRGGMVVNTRDELQMALEKGLLVMEYLPGAEFTVDCLNDLNGRLRFLHVRLRGKIGRNIALGTKGVFIAEVEDAVRRIAEEIRIEGPWFAQFKMDREGRPVLIEVNCRIAGSMTLTRLSGVNIPLLSVFLFLGYEVEIPRLIPDVLLNRCLRNLCEVKEFRWVIWDLDDTIIRKDGKPNPEAIACLYDLNNRGVTQLLLTKNPDADRLLKLHRIPIFFVEVRSTDDKLAELERLMTTYGIEPETCIVVNDSMTENLAIQKRFPQLRVITPAMLDMLGREKIF